MRTKHQRRVTEAFKVIHIKTEGIEKELDRLLALELTPSIRSRLLWKQKHLQSWLMEMKNIEEEITAEPQQTHPI